MMKIKFLVTCVILFGLTACAPPMPEKPRTMPDSASAKLAEAARSVSHSLHKLSMITAAASDHPVNEPPHPNSYGMGGLASVDWAGPVEPIVAQIAQATGYQLRVLGTKPAIPILVNINVQKKPFADILRDAGYQCGNKATVVVFPSTRVIELRYASV